MPKENIGVLPGTKFINPPIIYLQVPTYELDAVIWGYSGDKWRFESFWKWSFLPLMVWAQMTLELWGHSSSA